MSTYMLTSMFPNGLNEQAAEVFRQRISTRNRIAFVASEFEKGHDKTDYYFHFFLNMFEDAGIRFDEAYVIDGRLEAVKDREALIKSPVWNDAPRFFAGWTKATGNPAAFPRIFGANGGKRPSRTDAKPSGAIYGEVP